MAPQNKNPSNRDPNPMSRERERQRDREPREASENEKETDEENPMREQGGQQGGNKPYPGWEEETRGTSGREGGEEGHGIGTDSDEDLDEGGLDTDRDTPRR